MAQKIDYYSLLKSTADEDILNIPIQALKLSPKILGLFATSKYGFYSSNQNNFKTIKDILNCGKDGLMACFASKNIRYEELSEIIYEIEEQLARLGLKMKDSDFTVGDVRVENLTLPPQANKFVQKYKNKIQTLDDLSIVGYEKMVKFLPEGSSHVLLAIFKELEKFGLKVEDSPYRLKSERFFPLYEFRDYLPKEKKAEAIAIELERKKIQFKTQLSLDLTMLTNDELLNASVNELKVSDYVKQAFDYRGIETIGELIETPERKIRKLVSLDQFLSLEDELARLGLKFKDSQREFVDGKVVRHRFEKRLTDKAPAPTNVQAMSKKDKEKFLNTKISDFGFSYQITQYFAKQDKIVTIKDLISTPKNLIIDATSKYIVKSIEQALSEYNLTLQASEPKTQKHGNSKYINTLQIQSLNIPETITDEMKEEYKNLSLSDAGFTDEFIEILKTAGIEIKTLGDVISINRAVYKSAGITDHQIASMKKICRTFGMDIPATDKYDPIFDQVGALPIPTTESERRSLLDRDLSALGFSLKFIKQLKATANIHTVFDLTQTQTAKMREYLNQNMRTYYLIKQKLEEYGLSMISSSKQKNQPQASEANAPKLTATEKRALLDIYAKLRERVKPKNKITDVCDFIDAPEFDK